MTTTASVLVCPIDGTELELRQLEGEATCWVCPACEASRRQAKPRHSPRTEAGRPVLRQGALRLGDGSNVASRSANGLAAGVLSRRQAIEVFDGCLIPRIARPLAVDTPDHQPDVTQDRTVEAGEPTRPAPSADASSEVATAALADGAPIELFYDTIAEDFDRIMNRYDLQRRVDTIFDTILGRHDLRGRTLLDAGCGTGWFSQRAWERGAQVTALDIGPRLLREVRAKCPARTVCGDVLNMQFDDGAFDVVVSSECIEHTRNPARAVRELVRVCRPGGLIVITCPNRFWYWLCVVANRLHLRPYEGIEDWPRWKDLRRWIEGSNACVVEMRGIHLFPFQLSIFHPLLRLLDRFGKLHGRFCVNIAALAVKQC